MSVPYPRLLAAVAALTLASCGRADAPAADSPEAAGGQAAPGATAAPSRGGAAGRGSDVLGTIQATVDGQPRTWYVVSGESGGRPYASGMWMGEVPGERQVMAGGFDTRTPPLASFEWDVERGPLSYGGYDGSVFTLHVSEEAGPAPLSVRFPVEGMVDAGAFYQPRATLDDIMDNTYWLQEGSLEVATLAIEGGTARMEGTFSGVFRSMGGGDAVRMTDGRFDVRGLRDVRELQR